MKVFEMFAGYGGASFALKKLGIDFECVGYSEIDKFAVQCYEQNHQISKKGMLDGKVMSFKLPILNFGDCTKIEPLLLPDFDLLTGGFPCQAFSVAGKGLGELDTRGTLFNDIIRIAEVKKPKYMLLENVKGLINKRHKETFKKILSELDRIGYHVHWKVLNTKEHGIPQNRERVFFVCFRDYFEWKKFEYPEKEELKIFLKEILEDEVDEKYLLSKAHVKRLIESDDLKKSFSKFKTDGEPMFTLNTQDRHGILQIPHGANKGGIKAKDGVVPAMTANAQWQHNNFLLQNCTIRKLTPKECFRLMGFLEDQINLEGLSNSQRYKLAGNGWDINLVSKIFNQMFLSEKFI